MAWQGTATEDRQTLARCRVDPRSTRAYRSPAYRGKWMPRLRRADRLFCAPPVKDGRLLPTGRAGWSPQLGVCGWRI